MISLKPIYVQVLLIAAILFVLGQFIYVPFFGFAEPKIEGILFQIIERKGNIKTSLLFSLTLASIPVLSVMVWRLGPVASPIKRFAILVTILFFMVMAILVRQLEVKTFFIRAVKPVILPKDGAELRYPIDPVNFVFYMFAGLCIGAIISWISFRQKNI